MKYFTIVLFTSLLAVSCQKDNKVEVEKETVSKEKDTPFQMYEMSEGALLMEEMYAHNLQLKEKIMAGDALGSMPENFSKLPFVVLTDPTDKDDFFNKQAAEFLSFQKAIYTSDDPKQAFNAMVESCLECHSKKCGGPIPRIKTLLIP